MKVLVVGDTILDKYQYGKVGRLSPEAPVPILQADIASKSLGGACNVAVNIKSLVPDSEVDYYGICSYEIVEMLEEKGINAISISVPPNEIITKTRYISEGHQLLRVDHGEYYYDHSIRIMESLIEGVDLNSYDAIVVSDYNKGSISESLLSYITEANQKPNLFLDLKMFKDWMSSLDLKNSYIKCNNLEYEENRISVLRYCKSLGMVITQGKSGFKTERFGDGASSFTERFPITRIDGFVVNVVGAGDTFLAGMVAKFIIDKTSTLYSMAQMGNKVAAVRVRKHEMEVTMEELNEKFR